MANQEIDIQGARVHNLKDISVKIPRNKLVVITGVSGSGKSSLAFDTLYAEGQRRYVESLSSYARQFLDQLDKPDVDHIQGLSPAISIDQKSRSHNPRSTVGTVTEIYDYLRLLFASIGTPHCPSCQKPLKPYSAQDICQQVLKKHKGESLLILAPKMLNKKGEHRELLESITAAGYSRVLIDGKVERLADDISLDANKAHDIYIVVDRLQVDPEDASRLSDSVETALSAADGLLGICDPDIKNLQLFSESLYCIDCNESLPELSHRSFSFNSPIGACPQCKGIGSISDFDPKTIIQDASLSLAKIEDFALKTSKSRNGRYLRAWAKENGFTLRISFEELDEDQQDYFLYGDPRAQRQALQYRGPARWMFRPRCWEGAIPVLKRRYQHTQSDFMKQYYERFMSTQACSACKGSRLKPAAMNVDIQGENISALCNMPVDELLDFFATLKLTKTQATISTDLRKEITTRLDFLNNVGLDYLSLDRGAKTLSGGESQRIRLATQIGSGLTGVIYVLDEPSIGLHQKDNDKLLETLAHLKNLGNTVVVVEHDEDTIRTADFIVDVGPRAGQHGGQIVGAGPLSKILKSKESLTAQYLDGRLAIEVPKKRRKPEKGHEIEITGAKENNLKSVNVKIPLDIFTVVTGVSGSGKSSLILDILEPAIRKHFKQKVEHMGEHKAVKGLDKIDNVIAITQSPIGRTPRSNPVTYTGAFTPIRELFASTRDAKIQGYSAGRFSFNVKGGRCEQCQGDGLIKVDMHFLSDVYVTCDLCKGKRYNDATLSVTFKGHNINDVLNMTVNEAVELFENVPSIYKKIKTLQDVGLGYITLGQSATTLSGGEAQRIKLAKELSKRGGNTLYILDEPTTGLHMHDVNTLLTVLNHLVEKGNSMLLIEHNLDVIKCADHLIDLGPGAGKHGGTLVATGTPEQVAKKKGSYTGEYLKKILQPSKK